MSDQANDPIVANPPEKTDAIKAAREEDAQWIILLMTGLLDLGVKIAGALSLAGLTAGIAIVAALPSACDYKMMFVTSVNMARGSFTLMSFSLYIVLIFYFVSQITKTCFLWKLNIPKDSVRLPTWIMRTGFDDRRVLKCAVVLTLFVFSYYSLRLANDVVAVQLSTFWSIPTDIAELDKMGLCAKTPDPEPAPAQSAPQP